MKSTIFAEKTFTDCSLLLHQRMPHPQILHEKTVANSHKTVKFPKVFSLGSFPLYGMQPLGHVNTLRNLIGQMWLTSLYSRVVYILEWRHPYSSVSCTEYPPNSGHVFLPEWYVKKLLPPTDWRSSFVFYMTFELFKLCWVLIFLHTHFITVTENLSLLF